MEAGGEVAAQTDINGFEFGIFLDEEVEIFAAGGDDGIKDALVAEHGADGLAGDGDHVRVVFGCRHAALDGDGGGGADGGGGMLDHLGQLGQQAVHNRVALGAEVEGHLGEVGDGVEGGAAGLQLGGFDRPGLYRVEADGVDRADDRGGGVDGVDAEMGPGAVGRGAFNGSLGDVGSAVIESRGGLAGFGFLDRPQVDAGQDVEVIDRAGFDHREGAEQFFLRRLENNLDFALGGRRLGERLGGGQHHRRVGVVAAGVYALFRAVHGVEQRVHIAPEADHGSGDAAVEGAGDACAADAGADRVPGLGKFPGQVGGGLVLAEVNFGDGVKDVVDFFDSVVYFHLKRLLYADVGLRQESHDQHRDEGVGDRDGEQHGIVAGLDGGRPQQPAHVLDLGAHEEDGREENAHMASVQDLCGIERSGHAHAAAHRQPRPHQHGDGFAGQAEDRHDRTENFAKENEQTGYLENLDQRKRHQDVGQDAVDADVPALAGSVDEDVGQSFLFHGQSSLTRLR